MGLLEDKLMQAAAKDEKRDGDKPQPGARGSSLGSIMKARIRTQHQKVEDEDQSRQ